MFFGTLKNVTDAAILQSVKIIWLWHKRKILFQGNANLEVQFHKEQENICSQHTQSLHHLAHKHYCQPMM